MNLYYKIQKFKIKKKILNIALKLNIPNRLKARNFHTAKALFQYSENLLRITSRKFLVGNLQWLKYDVKRYTSFEPMLDNLACEKKKKKFVLI